MTYTGEVAKVLSVFAMVFVMIIVLHFIMLTFNIQLREHFQNESVHS